MLPKILIPKTQWILLFTCASMFALGLGDNIRGPLFAELIHHFQLSNTEASLSFAITSMFGFFGNLLAERLLRRISISRLLVISLILMAFSLSAMGAVGFFYGYLLSSAAFGFSMGLMGIAQNLMVAENISGDSQTKALSGLHALYGFSSLVAPFVASYGPSLLGTWRSGFFITAGAAFFVFGVSLFLHPKPKILSSGESSEHENIKPHQQVGAFSFILFGGVLAFYVVTEILVSSRLALYMREYFQLGLKESSLYVTYFFTFMWIGRVASIFKKLKSSLRKQLNILLVLTFICVIAGLSLHPFFLALSGLAMAPFYPLAIAYLAEQTHVQKRRYIAFAMAFQNLCLISMHLGVGYLTDQFGLLYAFGVGIISIVLSLICTNFHPRIPT